jgi:hypothetical protein
VKVKDFFEEVRFTINDVEKLEYTDNELLTYLNQAQDYIVNTCINHQYNRFLKTATLNTDTTSGQALPDDFVIEQSVYAGERELTPLTPDAVIKDGEPYYKIVGDKIYAGLSPITLTYYYHPERYTSYEQDLQLPRIFNNLLKEIVVFLALNRNEFNTSVEQQLAVLFEQKLLSLISAYGNGFIPLNLPFYC